MTTIELESRYTSGVYPKRDVAIVRGEGARVWDEEGRAYIDCVGGHGVAIVGHCNPAVVAAIQRQAETLITCPEVFYSDVRAKLLERLLSIAPAGLERAYLCNSGTESVEAALKLARLCTGRSEIVAMKRGFHGRTMGALSATWEPKYREPFMPLVPGFTHVTYGDLDALSAAVNDETAAVLLEVVQGEGGVNVGSGDYLRGVQALCAERGALLIVDEVQTGFGRTGKLFACQHHDLRPDLLCLAKGMAGGVPMGAVLIGSRVGELASGVHGSTFGGNPLACAAALAAIDYMLAHDLPGEAAEKGARFMQRLAGIETRLIREVRGLGLMVGIDLRKRVTPYLRALMDEGVLALPAGSTVLRLLPPLVISDDELDTVYRAVEKVLTA
ncbi:MAG TPA: aspartate aminotransferase family protein [Chloroflexi bacterium]|jgi:acetylornithine/LysW-gamma-L-lysine aminotransferase|nr:aspartate aminotransferase family protein [Chloroflexota bacterium]